MITALGVYFIGSPAMAPSAGSGPKLGRSMSFSTMRMMLELILCPFSTLAAL